MKKLLLGACIVFVGIFSANAQLPYLQNFETSMNALPGGWSVGVAGSHPTNPGWEFNNVYPAAGNSLWVSNDATHTYCAFIDDVDYNYTGMSWNNTTGQVNYDTLYTSSFSCSAATHVFMSFDLNFNNYTGYEVGTIAISTNGGATWTTVVNLPSGGGDVTWHNGDLFDISAAAAGQSNVMVAFTWNNAGAVSHYGAPGWGMAVDNINIYAPVDYDLSTVSQNLPYLMQVGVPYTFNGTIDNFGGSSVTSMRMNYSVNGGPVKSQAISGIVGFNALTSANWAMNAKPYTPSSTGLISVKYWADSIDGNNADENNANDTLVAKFMIIDSIQTKAVMFEEFSCASCNPCMYAMPNIDSVAQNTEAYCNTIRYHWYFPGQDMINQETSTICNGRMNTYYGEYGVPDGQVDGAYYYPGYAPVNYGYLSTAVIQKAQATGSPFKIDVTSTSYTKSTQTYSMTAVITSYGTFPAGLKAQVYLTEDSVDFKTDQSTEDPLNSFAPPLGSGSNPDYLYPYILNFPDAVEAALPSINGTSLSAFTPGSTQTVSVSWTKNHPWAAKYSSYPYDSSESAHMTIFIQDDNGNSNAGIPAKYVYQSKKVKLSTVTGVEELSNGVSFNMYPNPTNSNTNIAFTLDKDQNVTIQVYNMLGQQVYGNDQGILSAGEHTVIINSAGMQNGVYFVKFTADNATTTQKLVIQK